MSSTHYPTFRTWRIVVPITTALFGLLGGGTGLYALLSPGPEPLKLFGLTPTTDLNSNSSDQQRELALLKVYAIRNLSTAVANLGLLAFWRFSSVCRSSPAAAAAVQKVFAILTLSGVMVGLVDGMIVARYARSDALSVAAKRLALEKSQGHTSIMIPVVALAVGWWYL